MRCMARELARIRRLCLALPETSERLSHGSPTFFIREKRSFVTYQDDHHGDGRLAIWAAAPPGMQAMLVDGAPEAYFVPPYVGHNGVGRRPPGPRPGLGRDRRRGRGRVADARAEALADSTRVGHASSSVCDGRLSLRT